jgi:hypothetical protein
MKRVGKFLLMCGLLILGSWLAGDGTTWFGGMLMMFAGMMAGHHDGKKQGVREFLGAE